ncbi:unnamed protein product [Bemisia tabaci]|uniref:Uncharacterized protein n=1 Tax=Bemisia tabaci TaxID=7038 RepID=A0A9P0AD23_BEMTA|nr:unnamed protein product [Bemisia tabaci]
MGTKYKPLLFLLLAAYFQEAEPANADTDDGKADIVKKIQEKEAEIVNLRDSIENVIYKKSNETYARKMNEMKGEYREYISLYEENKTEKEKLADLEEECAERVDKVDQEIRNLKNLIQRSREDPERMLDLMEELEKKEDSREGIMETFERYKQPIRRGVQIRTLNIQILREKFRRVKREIEHGARAEVGEVKDEIERIQREIEKLRSKLDTAEG